MEMENLDQNSDTETPKSFKDADTFETVLSHVGPMGRYQKILFLAIMPFGFTYAYTYFVQMFIAVTPQNHWCRVPELANLSMELRRTLSAPGAASGSWDHCMTFDTNWTEVLEKLVPPLDGTALVPCQHGWEFELSDIPYPTISSEREWVCDRASYVPTAQSIFFIGAVVGTFCSGWLADRFGRVPAIVGVNLIGGIGGVATIFTTGVWDFFFWRFFAGLSYDNCFMILYILVLEFVGSEYRTTVANFSLAFSFTLASMTLPWLAYFIADWRVLMWVTSLPMFLVLLAPWFLPESVRWLVSRGRVEKALNILHTMERINKTKIPEEVINELTENSNKAKAEKTQSIFAMCKNPILRKAMISLILVYMGCGCVFDGLMRMIDSFKLSYFTLFCVNEFTEFVAVLLVSFMLDRFGRRSSACGPVFICCILAFSAMFVPEGLPSASLATLSRFFMTICYTTVMQWCTEILPTPFRASGVATLHMSAYVANTMSPYVAYSRHIWSKLPILIFTAMAFVTSGVCLTLPETKGQPMPQTKADGEKIILEHSYFYSKQRRYDKEDHHSS